MFPFEKNKAGSPWPLIMAVIAILICVAGSVYFFNRMIAHPVRPIAIKNPPKPRPRTGPKTVIGHIAIVLDDWGFNRTHCHYFHEFEGPVAAAVLPDLEFSKDVLQCVNEAGHEAMLHLPLEPHFNKDKYPRDYILTTQMPQREVLKLLRKILQDSPGIVGVNNHMGSKATEDKELMTTILTELKRRGLFFVDSVTSGKSICPEVAHQLKIPFARREIFLDNRNERRAIEKQFADAAKLAREEGYVLIIGHDRALTLDIVKEQMHKLKDQGFQFLSVNDLIKARRE